MREIIVPPIDASRSLRCYTTGLWSLNYDRRKPPYAGRGWSFGIRVYQYTGLHLDQHLASLHCRLGFYPHTDIQERTPDGPYRWRSCPEILIFAKSRCAAQRAANLLFAAMLVLDGQSLTYENIIAVPDDEAERQQNSPVKLHRDINAGTQRNVLTAAALAARLSTRRRWQYAAMKFWASHKACSISPHETHPTRGHSFGIEKDPANHVIFASAIIAAYSVIEELQFEVPATRDVPSRVGGEWNPPVKQKLESRLTDGGVNIGDDVMWIARGTPTRIERKRCLPHGKPASWAHGSVRDRSVLLIDAIARSSWLRSKVSSHRLSSLAASLTPYDVVNVQLLARRLLLETTGFLPAKGYGTAP